MGALVFALVGQSNGVGYQLPVQQYNLKDCWVIGINGITRPLTEPAFEARGQATGSIQHNVTDPNPGQSQLSSFCNQMRQLGVTDTLIVVPNALGGTTAAQWATNIAAAAPIRYTSLYGASIKTISQAMKAPSVKLGGVFINQGEAEAAAGTGATWAPTWGPILDAYLTAAVTNGWTWAKTKRFWVQGLQQASALGGAAALRTSQQLLASSRSDTIYFQEPNSSPPDLHLQPGPQNDLGVLQANSYFGAT